MPAPCARTPSATTTRSSRPRARPSRRTARPRSLEAVARRAGVGIGTLYRHFPTRQALLEAVYIGEVQQLCSATQELLALPPWESFVALSHRLVTYLATKKALAHELMNYVDREAAFFKSCRADLFIAGEPVLRRAQEAKVVRADTDFTEIIQLVGGIAKIEETATGSASTSSTSRSTGSATATDRAAGRVGSGSGQARADQAAGRSERAWGFRSLSASMAVRSR